MGKLDRQNPSLQTVRPDPAKEQAGEIRHVLQQEMFTGTLGKTSTHEADKDRDEAGQISLIIYQAMPSPACRASSTFRIDDLQTELLSFVRCKLADGLITGK